MGLCRNGNISHLFTNYTEGGLPSRNISLCNKLKLLPQMHFIFASQMHLVHFSHSGTFLLLLLLLLLLLQGLSSHYR